MAFIVVLFFFTVFCVGVAFMGLASIVSQKDRYVRDKLLSFECGFDPLSSSRMPFSLRFFLLALLFLIFDLEILLFLPFIVKVWCYSMKVGAVIKLLGVVFLMVLLGGLLHEVKEGSLDWEEDED